MALWADEYSPALSLLRRIFPPGLLRFLNQRRQQTRAAASKPAPPPLQQQPAPPAPPAEGQQQQPAKVSPAAHPLAAATAAPGPIGEGPPQPQREQQELEGRSSPVPQQYLSAPIGPRSAGLLAASLL